jgi:hypothetical protein
MPRRDGTGPWGDAGPRQYGQGRGGRGSGAGRGPDDDRGQDLGPGAGGRGRGRGLGRGGGRGQGRGMRQGWCGGSGGFEAEEYDPAQERAWLRQVAESLTQQLEQVRARLEALGSTDEPESKSD